jgi:multidrug efflux pump subunit AcrA (membrane-fusion protein)
MGLALGVFQAAGPTPTPAPPEPEARGQGVYNVVEGKTTITTVKFPVGAHVEKGELVCELEAFVTRSRLVEQQAATRAAEAPYREAQRQREKAESAIFEYLEITYKPQVKKIDHQISIVETQLKGAKDQLATMKKLTEKRLGPKSEVDAAEARVQNFQRSLDQLQSQKTTLEKYTREKTVKLLQSKVERAKAAELARQADYGREQAAEDQLKRELEHCKLVAPVAGRVSYPPMIEEGAEVTKGQLVFRVAPDPEPAPQAK